MTRLLLALVLLASCAAPSTPAAPAPAPSPSGGAPESTPSAPKAARSDIEIAGLQTALADGSLRLLIDVRTPGEFAAGHVPGARNIPLDTLPSRLAELGPASDGPVHVICQVGGRSSRATDMLVAEGYSATNVRGGTAGWIAAGNPTE